MSLSHSLRPCWVTRAVFTVSTVVLVGMTGCSKETPETSYHAYRQRKTEFQELLTKLGGTAEQEQFRVAGYEGRAWKIHLNGAQFSPEEGMQLITSLKPAGRIAAINFSGSSLTDEQLIQFDADSSGYTVMDLDLSNTAITDASIDKLSHFMALRNVNLNGTQVSKAAVDRWLDRRRQIPKLPAIFRNPKVTM
ncbi:MAG: hypothetical protein KF861_01540 [Planctomycetaceae bacterium]|nr:hypothetical protein [Planctomycetaceae bacterium]